MARIRDVLRALAREFHRDQRSLVSLVGNNFFVVTAFLLGKAGGFLYLLIGLVLLFPLSTDPLRAIPASRLALWPLKRGERAALRALSPWINPIAWLIAGLAVSAARGVVTVGLWALAAGLFAAAFLISNLTLSDNRTVWRFVPGFPGRSNHLVRKNIREMLATLDFYCALLLSMVAGTYSFVAANMPREEKFGLTVLIVLALSSYSQCLFGLEGPGGLVRYRLLPLRGWEALAAKDAAFLLIAIPLTLPLAPLAGMAAAFVALAMGHKPAVSQPHQQPRWRFSSGASIVFGLIQAIWMSLAAAGVFFQSALLLAPCLLWLVASTAYYGRELDRAARS